MQKLLSLSQHPNPSHTNTHPSSFIRLIRLSFSLFNYTAPNHLLAPLHPTTYPKTLSASISPHRLSMCLSPCPPCRTHHTPLSQPLTCVLTKQGKYIVSSTHIYMHETLPGRLENSVTHMPHLTVFVGGEHPETQATLSSACLTYQFIHALTHSRRHRLTHRLTHALVLPAHLLTL